MSQPFDFSDVFRSKIIGDSYRISECAWSNVRIHGQSRLMFLVLY